MTEELRKSIERIRSLAPDLNKATDEAQKVVARVEQFLDGCGIGVTAEAQFSNEDLDENMSRQRQLSYARVAGKFRIAVTATLCEMLENTTKFMPDEDNPPIAWGSCPRDIKLESFGRLPELLEKIADRASELSQAATDTTKTVKEILDAVPDDAVTGLHPHDNDAESAFYNMATARAAIRQVTTATSC